MGALRTAGLGCVLLAAGGAASLPTPSEDGPAHEWTIEEVLAGQRKSRDAISSLQYDYDFEQVKFLGPRGKLTTTGSGQAAARGPCRASSYTMVVTRADDGSKSESRVKAVLNDSYFAIQRSPNNPITLFHHPSASQPVAEERVHRTIGLPFDALLYAFGNGEEPLEQSLSIALDIDRAGSWKLQTSRDNDGRGWLALMYCTPAQPEPGTPRMRFEVDPQRGFLVTRFIIYGKDGSISFECTTKVEKIGTAGAWFPAEVSEVYYASQSAEDDASIKGQRQRDAEGRLIARIRTIKVRNVLVNEPLPDALFDWPETEDRWRIVRFGRPAAKRVAPETKSKQE